MSTVEPVVCKTSKHGKGCFSWSAVFVGALVAIGVSFLLNMFAVAIGLTAIAHSDSATTVAVGGLVGMVIIAIVSMGIGGWVAGHLGARKAYHYVDGAYYDGERTCNHGCLYGFTAWCVALVLTVFLSAHMGNFMAASTSTLTGPVVVQGVVASDAVGSSRVTVNKPEGASPTVTANVKAEDAAKAFALTSFVAFFLFFIGALAAAIAGHCAYACCCKKCVVEKKEYKV